MELFKNSNILAKSKPNIKNTLACLSGAKMGSNHEKNGGRKSHDTLPEMLVFILSSLNQEKKLSHGILMFYLLNDVAIEDCKYLYSITV